MRRSRLYFARRSERTIEPILIWPAATPTATSAIVASSDSPYRAETTTRIPADSASASASSVSVSVPTWFSLINTALPAL